MSKPRVSPYEFRKRDGVWQRRRIGTSTWCSLSVEAGSPSASAHRRRGEPQMSPSVWIWT